MKRIVLFLFLLSFSNGVYSQQNNLFEVSKNLDIYFSLFQELSLNYADEIHPAQLTRISIEAMLKSLDPYTNYITEDQVEDYRFLTSGEYGGIGVSTFQREGHTFISEVYEISPARQAGLKCGDRILNINGISLPGKSEEDISLLLKGESGSVLEITFDRNGMAQPKSVKIRREKISPPNVSYSGMVSDHTGLIRIEKFTEKAAEDVYNALLKLRQEQGFRHLIIDLRGNGGGLLDQAVSVVNLFVDKGQLIVSTKGKNQDRNRSYMTMQSPVDNKIPLLILVDESSASASEIVAGSLQDLDRAVIMGHKTFGKGLVQNILPLPYNHQLKITVAKYYIPSGRCIQAVDYSDHSGKPSKTIPDSLKSLFYTRGGRMVYDGGGIEPDIEPTSNQFNPIISSMFQNYAFFDFANEFALNHPAVPSPDSFQITQEIYKQFAEFLMKRHSGWDDQANQVLSDLRTLLKEENRLTPEKENQIELLEKSLKGDISLALQEARRDIEYLLRLEIITRYYYQSGRIKTLLKGDPEIEQALAILTQPEIYKSILEGVHPECHNRKRQDKN